MEDIIINKKVMCCMSNSSKVLSFVNSEASYNSALPGMHKKTKGCCFLFEAPSLSFRSQERRRIQEHGEKDTDLYVSYLLHVNINQSEAAC